jgi:hypothetical protein
MERAFYSAIVFNLADPAGYIFKWLVGYSGGLGAIAGRHQPVVGDHQLERIAAGSRSSTRPSACWMTSELPLGAAEFSRDQEVMPVTPFTI